MSSMGARVKCIIVTGYASKESAIEAVKSGCSAVPGKTLLCFAAFDHGEKPPWGNNRPLLWLRVL